jgi:hypothetical protein
MMAADQSSRRPVRAGEGGNDPKHHGDVRYLMDADVQFPRCRDRPGAQDGVAHVADELTDGSRGSA